MRTLPGTWALISALAYAAPAAAADMKAVQESREVARQVSVELRDQLIREMQLSGPLRSMIVCKFTCPEIIFRPARRTGWRIAAVSLTPRNPALGSPDAWEQRVLVEFRDRVARGESADRLESWEVVTEPSGRFLRYAKAMPVEKMCLACHGPPESLAPAVKAQLALDYPHDRATGLSVGQVHGIVTIKRPL